MSFVDPYRGDSVFLAVLSENSRPRAVCYQFGHDLRGRISGHSPSGEGRRSASAEGKRPAGTGRIGSNTAAKSCLSRVA